MQRSLRQLSSEWEAELLYARRELGEERYGNEVEKFIGTLLPGRPSIMSSITESVEERSMHHNQDEDPKTETAGSELLDALRVPYQIPAQQGGQYTQTGDEGDIMVCNLRTAITCVQNTKPRDILPELLRLFP